MNLSFHAYRRSSQVWEMTQPHFHSDVEILFPLTDGGSIFIDNKPYPLQTGHLFLMDAAMPHRSFSHCLGDYTRCVLHFPPQIAHELGLTSLPRLLAEKGCCAHLSAEDFALCRTLFEDLLLSGNDLSTSLLRSAAFLRLMALVARLWTAPSAALPSAGDDSTVAAVIDYIRTHLTQPLTLDGLAAQFYLSKSTLCHRFKASTGFSVMDYVIHCRIRHARALLGSGCSVQQAGEAAGFGDNAHFIRSFRRITGMTPGQFARSTQVEIHSSLPDET